MDNIDIFNCATCALESIPYTIVDFFAPLCSAAVWLRQTAAWLPQAKKKAFDSIWHIALFHKLETNNINGNFLELLKNIYVNRVNVQLR